VLHAHDVGMFVTNLQQSTCCHSCNLLPTNMFVCLPQAGDVLAIVGSSTDLLPLAERSYSMDLLVPRSGALLWADVWVVPTGAKGGHLQTGPSPILPSWLEFCTQPARAGSLNGLRWGGGMGCGSKSQGVTMPAATLLAW
jgi:hypothetical protein